MNRKNGRNTDGTFAQGNPGRPKGSRNKATIAALTLLDGHAEALSKRAIQLALAGDTTALRLCLNRVAPAKKDQVVILDLQDVKCASDIVAVALVVVRAIASGELTPLEGCRIMTVLESYRKLFEAAELEARVLSLEEAINEGGRSTEI